MAASFGAKAIGTMNQRNVLKGSSALAEAQGQAEAESFDRMARRLAKQQRFVLGEAKMSQADSGYGQDQSMMVKAELLNNMSEDIVETRARGEAALRRGQTQAGIYEGRASAAVIQGVGDLGVMAIQGYSTMKDAGLFSGGANTNIAPPPGGFNPYADLGGGDWQA